MTFLGVMLLTSACVMLGSFAGFLLIKEWMK